MRHVVMFSSGAGSWAAARRVADERGTDGLVLLFADVKGEDEDNYRFLVEAAADIYGIALSGGWADGADTRRDFHVLAAQHVPGLAWIGDGRTIWDVFRDDRFPAETTVYVGIDWTEMHRLPAIERAYLPYTAKAPLCEPPYISRHQVFDELKRRGIRRPRLYDLGMEHANCGGGCVRAGQGQFARLLEVMPDRFAEWERQEEGLRTYLGKDVSILRDRTGGELRPLTLREFRERAESRPEQIDLFDIGGCGCFVAEESA